MWSLSGRGILSLSPQMPHLLIWLPKQKADKKTQLENR